MGRSGVIASLSAASQRLQTNEQQEMIKPFISSITSMEPEHFLEAAKDAGGARVIEAFLNSNATIKQKRRLLVKLRGHYGEIAMHPSGSFTIEKCFDASNLSLKEAIVSELVAVQAELSKSRQGPYLLRKLDVDEYASKPDWWRARQESKKSAYNEFYEAFGSGEANSRKFDFLSDGSKHSLKPKISTNRKQEMDDISLEKGGKLGKRKKGVGSEDASGSGEPMKAASENKIPFLSYGKWDKKRKKKI